MYGKRFKLCELFGFKVYIDLNWLIIAALVTGVLTLKELLSFLSHKVELEGI